jgi:N6-L-threonylcarbamoyladenine synthase
MNVMLVLGIETSCDETAAAVVADGERILSNAVASQVLTHDKYGGVVPEIASREHLRKIDLIVEEALARAGASLNSIDAIAVTEGPGLIGSLLVGVVYGKGLAFSLRKPLVGVNHLEGHIHAVLLENKRQRMLNATVVAASLPAVALVVSGGHTSLFLVKSTKDDGATRFEYTSLGQTRDDAAGEAFDKVAKLLALGYPGGPTIDRLANFGNADAVEFGRIKMRGNPLDFSFSGIKTAVLYRVRGSALAAEAETRRAWRKTVTGRVTVEEVRAQCSTETLNLVASFQDAVVSDLVARTLAAAEAHAVSTILVTGGVACNSLLRSRFAEAARARAMNAFFPSLDLSTDNAAMIAAAGYHRLAAGERAGISLTAHATFPLAK